MRINKYETYDQNWNQKEEDAQGSAYLLFSKSDYIDRKMYAQLNKE